MAGRHPVSSMSTNILQASMALDCRCTLGEGIVWDAARRTWWWTDIERSHLYRWDGLGVTARRHDLPDRLGSLAVSAGGRLLLGLARGIAWCDVGSDDIKITSCAPLQEETDSTRVNDGRADRSGNFVFGTMHEAPSKLPVGSFYQYSADHGLRKLGLPGVCIPNSICFSPDGGTLYFTDSLRGVIFRCRYDADSAKVGAPRAFVRLSSPAEPDGSVVDADGCLWNAQWGTGVVQRYSPSGERLQSVLVSVPHVTCPAFGGNGLTKLMITSARQGLSDRALDAAPLSGSVFQCEVPGCTGLADTPLRDEANAP